MSLLDDERYLINERIRKIKETKERATGDREIVIAGGIPVLKEHEEEMKNLKQLLDILDASMAQKSNTEYLDIRDKTSLPILNEQQKDLLISREAQLETEKRKIQNRLIGITTKYFAPSIQVTYQTASDGKSINAGDLEEYERCLQMQEIIKSGFDTENYYEYMVLREQTRLGKIDDTRYQILMGKPAPTLSNTEYAKAQNNIEPIPSINEPIKQNEALSPIQNHLKPQETDEEVIIDVENLSEGEKALDSHTPEQEPEEEIEVIKTSPWKWIKNHKKQILIGLGLTALSITAVMTITQLLPALVAASKASQVAGLASQMLSNGSMWFTANATEQLALHGANTALANVISSLTGVTSNFTTASGLWTIGGQALPEFATSAITAAGTAASKVTALTSAASIGSLGGFGLLGAGLMPSKNKSKAYSEILRMLSKLKANINTMEKSEQNKQIQSITMKIIESDSLSSKERDILFRKLRKAIRKQKSMELPVQQREPIDQNRPESATNNSNSSQEDELEFVGVQKTTIDKNNIIDVEYIDIEKPDIQKTM